MTSTPLLRGAMALIALLAFTGAPTPIEAQETLRIGVKESPPFVLRGEDGEWTGISVELLARLASALGFEYELVPSDLPTLFSGVENGSIDAGVAAITVTSERERRFDFSHPFHATGLGIAVAPENEGPFSMIRGLFSTELLQGLFALALVLFVAGLLVWIFERRRNSEEFGGTPLEGLGSSFWWSAVTMTTVGYGDKAPRTLGGRLVALIWMFASVITISSFTAAIASTLTVGRLTTSIQSPNDLPGKVVATVPGSTSASYLSSEGIATRGFPDVESGLRALAAGHVDAMVYDAPILRYLTRTTFAGQLTTLPVTFRRQDYAFLLPSGSARRDSWNAALLEILVTGDWDDLLKKYVGEP